ncbi:MAG: sulfotransferase [Anaerolineales bacterium]|nr:sulfotransferase [Anaerolineales bacterium]
MENNSPKRIVILGIMRSGTSLTAELVRLWGAYAGAENELWKSDASDPRGYGYMEYIPLQNLNDELLGYNETVPPADEILEEKASDPAYREKALELIRAMDQRAVEANAVAWVWKDARTVLTLPFWAKILADPIYVITLRHPAETALSAAKTEEMDEENIPFSAGLAYWQYCMLNILTFTQDNPRKMFVAYDQLLSKPLQECTHLGHFLDEHCGKSPEDSQARIDAMLPQISTGERHYKYTKSLAEMEQVTREQRALYNFLRVKTLYPHEAFSKDDFALYPGWKEYLQCMDMLMAMSKAQYDNNTK